MVFASSSKYPLSILVHMSRSTDSRLFISPRCSHGSSFLAIYFHLLLDRFRSVEISYEVQNQQSIRYHETQSTVVDRGLWAGESARSRGWGFCLFSVKSFLLVFSPLPTCIVSAIAHPLKDDSESQTLTQTCASSRDHRGNS